MSIQKSIEQVQAKMLEQVKEYSIRMKALREELEAIRNKCPHNNLTFVSDPSGNNDSCHICDECGKEIS
jgi:phosphopantetheine adenylyltransferase